MGGAAENPRLDRVATPGPAAQRRTGDGAARRADHLVFDRQPAGARARAYALSGLLRARFGLRSERARQDAAPGAPSGSCVKSMTARGSRHTIRFEGVMTEVEF